MINAYDIAYALGVGISAPVWLAMPGARRKVRSALAQRMGHVARRVGAEKAVLIHAVSLGEINAARGLVQRLRELRPDLHIVVSATTETGFARAQELYGQAKGISVIRFPLDFTSAVCRTLDDLRPAAVVLMELEVWPNFMLQCAKRGIAVMLVNGRITEPSFRRYRWGMPVVRRMFNRLSAACAQNQGYADQFVALGAVPERVQVTGTMKFDTATVAERIPGDEQLAREVGLAMEADADNRSGAVWVCGSTGPGEEELILDQYRALLEQWPTLRLVLVPRKPERFDEVATLVVERGLGLVRRSGKEGSPGGANGRAPAVVLGDTMGELRKFYSLADIVFVGRTLVDLGPRQHGSDMIEPAALGKPVIVGPYTGNFSDAMAAFREARAIVEVRTAEELGEKVQELLRSLEEARSMGTRAREVVEKGKGATERHVQIILRHIEVS